MPTLESFYASCDHVTRSISLFVPWFQGLFLTGTHTFHDWHEKWENWWHRAGFGWNRADGSWLEVGERGRNRKRKKNTMLSVEKHLITAALAGLVSSHSVSCIQYTKGYFFSHWACKTLKQICYHKPKICNLSIYFWMFSVCAVTQRDQNFICISVKIIWDKKYTQSGLRLSEFSHCSMNWALKMCTGSVKKQAVPQWAVIALGMVANIW